MSNTSNAKFILSCESTVDMPFSYIDSRDIPVLFYNYTVDGTDYVDDMLRDPEALPRFYSMLEADKLPTTSQINSYRYEEFFDSLLKNGDVLHITFGTGMTKSYQNAVMAAKNMQEKYPDRRIIVIDSLCSSSGYGMLVDYAADMRDEGAEMDEVESWVNANRKNIHHQFYSTTLKFFRRTGRVSGAAAMIGNILGICPIMHLNADGKIIAYGKVRGKHNALITTVDTTEEHIKDGRDYDGKLYICHSNCPEDAEHTRVALAERFPKVADIKIFDIGTIIASHCGPGTVAVFFLGDERAAD